MGIIILGFFTLLLFLGVPIAVSLGLACLFAVGVTDIFPIQVLVQKMFNTSNSFSLMAIPFFVLAGNIMSSGGVSKRLVNFSASLFGHVAGGLAVVATTACTFFSAVSGSAPATTAAIGGVMLKPMAEKGYDKNFSGAVVAASGTLGLVIPPSLTMVLYGVATGVSIGDMFIAGIIPGILMAVVLIVVESVISRNRGYRGQGRTTNKEKMTALKESLWALLMPVIILGGIYSGVFTPTEAAAVSVIYGLIIGIFVYKEVKIKDLPKLVLDSANSTALIMYLMISADVLSYVLVSEQIPQSIAVSILGFSSNANIILLLIIALLIVFALFLNNSAAMVLFAPILFPIIVKVGIDPLFFGIIMTMTLAVSQCTPPVALCLFVACDLGKLKFEELVKEVTPLVIALFILVGVLSFLPQVVLFLPNLIRH